MDPKVLLSLLNIPGMRALAVTAILAFLRGLVNSPNAEDQLNALIDQFLPKK